MKRDSTIKKSCGNCEWCIKDEILEDNDDKGLCAYNPPVVMYSSGAVAAMLPRVSKNSKCHLFKLRK